MNAEKSDGPVSESGESTSRPPWKQSLINAGLVLLVTLFLSMILPVFFQSVDPSFVGETVGRVMFPVILVVFVTSWIWCSGHKAVALGCAGFFLIVAVLFIFAVISAIRQPRADFENLAKSGFETITVDGQTQIRHVSLGMHFDPGEGSFEQTSSDSPDESTYAWSFLNIDSRTSVVVFASHRLLSNEQHLRDFLAGFLQGMENTADEHETELSLVRTVEWSGGGGEAIAEGSVAEGFLSIRILSFDRGRMGFPFVMAIQVASNEPGNAQTISRSFSLGRSNTGSPN